MPIFPAILETDDKMLGRDDDHPVDDVEAEIGIFYHDLYCRKTRSV